MFSKKACEIRFIRNFADPKRSWSHQNGIFKISVYLYITTNLFFKCRCSEEDFNAKPAVPSHLCHSLIELLSQLSPAFKRNFATLQKKRTQRHPFERVATPYQVYAWASPQAEHTVDAIRAEDSKYLLIIFYYRV